MFSIFLDNWSKWLSEYIYCQWWGIIYNDSLSESVCFFIFVSDRHFSSSFSFSFSFHNLFFNFIFFFYLFFLWFLLSFLLLFLFPLPPCLLTCPTMPCLFLWYYFFFLFTPVGVTWCFSFTASHYFSGILTLSFSFSYLSTFHSLTFCLFHFSPTWRLPLSNFVLSLISTFPFLFLLFFLINSFLEFPPSLVHSFFPALSSKKRCSLNFFEPF